MVEVIETVERLVDVGCITKADLVRFGHVGHLSSFHDCFALPCLAVGGKCVIFRHEERRTHTHPSHPIHPTHLPSHPSIQPPPQHQTQVRVPVEVDPSLLPGPDAKRAQPSSALDIDGDDLDHGDDGNLIPKRR